MNLKIVSYVPQLGDAVADFNERLKAGGSSFSFRPDQPWLPPRDDISLFQEFFLACDEGGAVRGAYLLKHQDFWVKNRVTRVSDLGLPLSEGTVNPQYHPVGVFLIRHAIKHSVYMYGLGMGGVTTNVARTLKALGCSLELVPFFFRVVRPIPFLKNIRVLRKSSLRRWLLDLLAYSGIGWAGNHALRIVLPKPRLGLDVSFHALEEFGTWCDVIWETAKPTYDLVAVRTHDVLNILYPPSDSKFLKICVTRGGDPIGWAVMLNTRMKNHKQFADMEVGTIVDVFAIPGAESSVIAAATICLEQKGTDLIVSNQASPIWQVALKQAGLLTGPSNFALALSPALRKELGKASLSEASIHINRGDGDGPIHL
jgi:hypothetical protein